MTNVQINPQHRRPNILLATFGCLGISLASLVLCYGVCFLAIPSPYYGDMRGLVVMVLGSLFLMFPGALAIGFCCEWICRGHYFIIRLFAANPMVLLLVCAVVMILASPFQSALGILCPLFLAACVCGAFSILGSIIWQRTIGPRRAVRGFEPVFPKGDS